MVKYTQEKLDEYFRCTEMNDRSIFRCFGEIILHDDLSYLDLSGLNFGDHDLRTFTLRRSNLKGADLSSTLISTKTSFEDAIFDENTKMPFVKSICPEEGSFIGYKKALDRISIRACIVKLLIPEDAKRTSGLGPKCRCDKAKVLDIKLIGIDYKSVSEAVSEAMSLYDRAFVYRVGETVEIEDFDECRWHRCAPGIHFYMDPALAILH